MCGLYFPKGKGSLGATHPHLEVGQGIPCDTLGKLKIDVFLPCQCSSPRLSQHSQASDEMNGSTVNGTTVVTNRLWHQTAWMESLSLQLPAVWFWAKC